MDVQRDGFSTVLTVLVALCRPEKAISFIPCRSFRIARALPGSSRILKYRIESKGFVVENEHRSVFPNPVAGYLWFANFRSAAAVGPIVSQGLRAPF